MRHKCDNYERRIRQYAHCNSKQSSECTSATITNTHRNALTELRESLELLDLSNNCLTSVPATVLRGHNKLMYLDLSNNQIDDLPNMQFMNMPLLREVKAI